MFSSTAALSCLETHLPTKVAASLAVSGPAWVYHILRTANIMLWVIDLGDDGLLEATEETKKYLTQARISLVPDAELRFQKNLVIGNKTDLPEAMDRLAILKEVLTDIDILPVSAETGLGLEELKRRLFKLLDIIRVYTKKPGKPPVMEDPVILPTGASLWDAAHHLHKEIAANMQFARLWNKTGYDGQRVERAHVLADQDIVEFHT
jgi:ribosome-interacting GTPase 1